VLTMRPLPFSLMGDWLRTAATVALTIAAISFPREALRAKTAACSQLSSLRMAPQMTSIIASRSSIGNVQADAQGWAWPCSTAVGSSISSDLHETREVPASISRTYS
jgi:hypothetical protein